jgi:hypothetical protein
MQTRYRFFGEIALERGLVNVESLVDALNAQARCVRSGQRPKLLGQVLLEAGVMTEDGIGEVLDELFPIDHIALTY